MNQQIRIWLLVVGCLFLSACIAPVEQINDCSSKDANAKEAQADSYWVGCELIVTGPPDEIDKTIDAIMLPRFGALKDFLVLLEEEQAIPIDAPLANNLAFRYSMAVEWGRQALPRQFAEKLRANNKAVSNQDVKLIFNLIAKQIATRQSEGDPKRFQEILNRLGVKGWEEWMEPLQKEIENFNGIPSPEQLEKLTVRRYAITKQPVAVAQVVQAIHTFRYGEGKELFVFADPNYLTSLTPHIIGNGPFGAPAIAEAGSVRDPDFQNQWALQQSAGFTAAQPADSPIEKIAGQERGGKVRVVVFDTSPFSKEQVATLTQVLPPLSLTVLHPPLQALSLPSGIPTPAPPPDPRLNEHGLFVAGLVHAIVPNSEIQLIRTSHDDGHGTLKDFSIEFVAAVQRARQEGVQNLVVNLSGGVFCPKDCWQALLPTSCRENALRCAEEREEIAYLSLPLLNAEWLDVLDANFSLEVVAAAGNDSYLSLNSLTPPIQPRNPPFEPERPAAYWHVVGVAATTQESLRACYSNHVYRPSIGFDLAAPGGDGGAATIPTKISGSMVKVDYACASLRAACEKDTACLTEKGLISLVTDPAGIGEEFAYWSGTSFATPLTSGVVALCMSRGASAYELAVKADTTSPDGKWLGRGVLRIPEVCR